MDATYNSKSRVGAIAITQNQQWTLLELLMVIFLTLYVAASLLPREIGHCSQSVSVIPEASYFETAAA